MADNTAQKDLTVKGDSVERIYGNYRDERYLVNRKYQRKLVWTIEEKIGFIDSITKGFPVPIILLAEIPSENRNVFEIIDGMQRMNAVMSFIENEYAVAGAFFDLNTMAETKQLLDSGDLVQKEPVMSRDVCVSIVSYTVPVSIYEFSRGNDIDEVFRRINSGGRKLSRQELRAAGATGYFAQVVRVVANEVRGDSSPSDLLLLNNMKMISITNKDLQYGISVDSIFWVSQGVLTKEQVRESIDEQIIADILAYILLDPPPSSRSEFIDDYFGIREGEVSLQRFNAIELEVQKHTIDNISIDFKRVLDIIKQASVVAQKTFTQLVFGAQMKSVPRYFQVVFLALHKLIVKENKEVSDYHRLVELLDGSSSHINIPEGGKWGGIDRQRTINSAVSMYADAFVPAKEYDPATVRWITQFENILRQLYIEQAPYDFKQGFLRLGKSIKFDEGSFEKILKTLVGISNIKKGTKGYVIIGVAENKSSAIFIEKTFGVSANKVDNFYITGIEHEAKNLGKSRDELYQWITDKVKNSLVSSPLREYIARNMKIIKYYDKSIVIFESLSQEDPSSYDNTYYERHGNQLEEIDKKDLATLFRRFYSGS